MRVINAFEFIGRVAGRYPKTALPKISDILLESNGTVLVVRRKEKTAWISVAVGEGMGWIRELYRTLAKQGINLVGFSTSEYNEPVRALAKYFKAEEIKTSQKYEDGSQVLQYKINLENWRFTRG